jgi:GH24 family phage-related lysozyme (muramidase)
VDREKLKAELIEDEGRKKYPYKDTKGIWTGGIGHNLEAHKASWQDIAMWLKAGIPDAVIDGWYDEDSADAVEVAQAIFGDVEALPDCVARSLVNMAFDLEWELRQWPHLIAAVRAKNWDAAAQSILASKFNIEAPNRCRRLADRVMEGKGEPK